MCYPQNVIRWLGKNVVHFNLRRNHSSERSEYRQVAILLHIGTVNGHGIQARRFRACFDSL